MSSVHHRKSVGGKTAHFLLMVLSGLFHAFYVERAPLLELLTVNITVVTLDGTKPLSCLKSALLVFFNLVTSQKCLLCYQVFGAGASRKCFLIHMYLPDWNGRGLTPADLVVSKFCVSYRQRMLHLSGIVTCRLIISGV